MEGETKTVSDGWTGLVADPATPRRGADAGAAGRFGLEIVEAPLPSSTRIGRFVLDRRLGAGGMGIVYAAFDPELDREVAIKLVRASLDDERARAQTLREAQAMARLSHPNVVQVYDLVDVLRYALASRNLEIMASETCSNPACAGSIMDRF